MASGYRNERARKIEGANIAILLNTQSGKPMEVSHLLNFSTPTFIENRLGIDLTHVSK